MGSEPSGLQSTLRILGFTLRILGFACACAFAALILIGSAALSALGAPGKGGGSASASASASVSKPAPPPPPRSVSAIADIAAELDAALPPLPAKAIVAIAPLVTDVNAPRAKALATTIGTVFAGKRGLEAPPEPESLDAVRARISNVRTIVYLTPTIANGELMVTADAYPVPKSIWAQIRNPNPGPFAHAFGKAFIDAEVRSHLEPVQLGALETSVGRNFEPNVLALACDDVDRDGAPEIVSLSATSVTIVRIRDKKLEIAHHRQWSDLSPRASAPLQEPIGALAVLGGASLGPRSVVASVTDRANAARLDETLDTLETFRGMAIPDGAAYACARFPALSITGPLVACSDTSPAPTRGSVGGQYDALAAAHLVSPDGKPFEVFAGREGNMLEIFDDSNHVVKGPEVGAQLAIGDIDQDGNPEILSSANVVYPAPDSVTIRTWDRKINVLRDVMTFPVAAGVHAIAVCPPEANRRAPFVIATIDDLAVLR
jgi:hypothetical protein